MDEDYLLAIQLQEQFDHEASRSTVSDEGDSFGQSSKKRKVESGSSSVIPYSRPRVDPERPLSIVDDSWETLDPNPDVRSMFLEFNDTFFWGKLCGVEVKWSPRMTLCAGVCSYEGRGGLCSIRLSEPLLKLRPRRDLVQTLLHEMIHALLFVTQNNRDRDGHGPEFCRHMDRINQATGTKITVYHTFNDEVDLYRQHWWRCDGPCQNRKPFFGYVKRAMNRAPSSLDPWWGGHQSSCGGTYTKVKEPEGYGKKGKAKGEGSKEKGKTKGEGSKDGFETKPTASRKPSSTTAGSGLQDIRNIIPFSGKGFLLGGSSQSSSSSSTNKPSGPSPTQPAVFPPVSPAKPLMSPPALSANKTVGSSGLLNGSSPIRGSNTSSPAGGVPSAPPSKRPPMKKSVSNTRVFVNINGSPVRIPKPSRQVANPMNTLPKTKQQSVQDLFNSRSLQTSQSAAGPSTVSKPPEEIQTRDPTSQSGGISSRKRPWDNRTSANIFDFFQKTMGESSSSSSTTTSRDRRQGGASGAALPAPSTSTPVAQASFGASTSLTVSCPVCQVKVPEAKINEHLDSCLS
ncbi:DNA-dependent metalloprotease SPRTN [Osmerus mordax]|uniref:DNA-dependent metalloprotease SPRTN n=1 Tax=Osmerus mordax TaxID=8014 RepID=UPI00350FD7AF